MNKLFSIGLDPSRKDKEEKLKPMGENEIYLQ